MQADVDVFLLCQCRRALGIPHKDHCTYRGNSFPAMTLHGGVGLGSRATPVIGINGKHGNETSALGKALFYAAQPPTKRMRRMGRVRSSHILTLLRAQS